MTNKNTNPASQIMLIILDGWGYSENPLNNAVKSAQTPVFNGLWNKYPHTLLDASGLAVGLPDKQMGNSEIGHQTIGAGKVIDTDLVKIDKAIETGEFAENPVFTALFDHINKNNSTLHVQGLLSDGGVHSHQKHLYAFLKTAKHAGIKKVAIHIFTDGRDTAPQSAGKYIKELESMISEIGIGTIASISGRFYAMDRDNNWDRLAKAESALFECKGNICDIKPSEYIENLYKDGKLDEHLEPTVCLDLNGKGCAVEKNDAIFFFNFRSDRARMLSSKIMERSPKENICFATMTEYGSEFKCHIAFPPSKIETTLATEISNNNLTQAHIAETEKFPHATYFLNGGREKPHAGEKHIMLDSRKDVATHDLAPKMRAESIADKAIEEIQAGTNFIFINFANPDMVGHTANVPAIIEAVEEVDKQLGRVLNELEKRNGIAFITADHGNAELNIDPETGKNHTSHTINPVPAILTSETNTLRIGGGLSDIAPTVLELFKISQPKVMTGKSLLK